MSILNCKRLKSMVVETIDDTVTILRKGPDLFEVKFEGFEEVELYTTDQLEALFRED